MLLDCELDGFHQQEKNQTHPTHNHKFHQGKRDQRKQPSKAKVISPGDGGGPSICQIRNLSENHQKDKK
jgi:hypothetical protein